MKNRSIQLETLDSHRQLQESELLNSPNIEKNHNQNKEKSRKKTSNKHLMVMRADLMN